jgi:hypothetical protein
LNKSQLNIVRIVHKNWCNQYSLKYSTTDVIKNGSMCIKTLRICGWKVLVKLDIQGKRFGQLYAIESLVQK